MGRGRCQAGAVTWLQQTGAGARPAGGRDRGKEQELGAGARARSDVLRVPLSAMAILAGLVVLLTGVSAGLSPPDSGDSFQHFPATGLQGEGSGLVGFCQVWFVRIGAVWFSLMWFDLVCYGMV